MGDRGGWELAQRAEGQGGLGDVPHRGFPRSSFSVKKLFVPNRNIGGFRNSKQAAQCSRVLHAAHAVKLTKLRGLRVCASHSSFQAFLNGRKHNSIYKNSNSTFLLSTSHFWNKKEGNSILVFITVAELSILNLMVVFSIDCSSSLLFHHTPPHVVCWIFFCLWF